MTKGLNIGTNVSESYSKKVTKFGNGAKISCSKKYIQKEVLVVIPKKKDLIKKKDLNIKKDVEALYSKKVTKFGTGAKIDCSKDYIGKEAIIFIL